MFARRNAVSALLARSGARSSVGKSNGLLIQGLGAGRSKIAVRRPWGDILKQRDTTGNSSGRDQDVTSGPPGPRSRT